MTHEPITEFRGQHRFLSNFYPTPHCPWPTAEHYFQSCKTNDREQRIWIFSASTPGVAKRRGNRVELRPDWEEVKVLAMRGALGLKFEYHTRLADMLLATEHRMLVEGNTWGDTVWGQSPVGTGSNLLGVLLMERRGQLRYLEGTP